MKSQKKVEKANYGSALEDDRLESASSFKRLAEDDKTQLVTTVAKEVR